jgi:hypothetical protein
MEVMKGTEVNPSKLQVNLFSSKLERGLVQVMEWCWRKGAHGFEYGLIHPTKSDHCIGVSYMGDGVMKGTEVNPSKLQVNLFSSKLERGLLQVMEWCWRKGAHGFEYGLIHPTKSDHCIGVLVVISAFNAAPQPWFACHRSIVMRMFVVRAFSPATCCFKWWCMDDLPYETGKGVVNKTLI